MVDVLGFGFNTADATESQEEDGNSQDTSIKKEDMPRLLVVFPSH
jgi:hypothetical protein